MSRPRIGLAFFRRTSSKRIVNLVSLHSPHSLTWSWILSFAFYERGNGENRVWPLFAPFRTNQGLQWILRVPFVGYFQWHRQQPMWFRDLYMRKREEFDDLHRIARNAEEIIDRIGKPTLVHSADDTVH